MNQYFYRLLIFCTNYLDSLVNMLQTIFLISLYVIYTNHIELSVSRIRCGQGCKTHVPKHKPEKQSLLYLPRGANTANL